MEFGTVAIDKAEGGIAVHSIRLGDLVVKKGTVLDSVRIEALRAAGVSEIVVARLAPGDVAEDEAAAAVASRLAGSGVRVDAAFTGRANLYAEDAGVLRIDRAGVDRLNRVDESITLA